MKKILLILCKLIPVAKWRRKLRKKIKEATNAIELNLENTENWPKIPRININAELSSDNIIKKVIILNETDSLNKYQHLGCAIVMENIRFLCKKYSMDIIKEYKNYESIPNDILREVDGVIVNGEGSLHHNRGKIIFDNVKKAKEMGISVFLINSGWQYNSLIKDNLSLFDIITVRESNSLKEIVKDGAKNAYIVPDLSFYVAKTMSIPEIKRDKNILFTDSVISEKKDAIKEICKIYKGDMLYMYGDNPLLESLEQLNNYNFIVSGRFHVTCLAMVLQIPVISIGSNTYKIEGLLSDAKINDEYFIDDMSNLKESRVKIDNFISKINHDDYINKSNDYVSNAVCRIEKLFMDIYKDI